MHPLGAMVEACDKALDMLKPEHAKRLLAPKVQSVATRYSGRSDEKPPAMEFSEATMALAHRTFTQGKFKARSHFQNIVGKYVSLPKKQHDKLVQDLALGPMFKKLENEKRFSIFLASGGEWEIIRRAFVFVNG